MTLRVSLIQLASMVARLFPLQFQVQTFSTVMHGGIPLETAFFIAEEATTANPKPGTQSWWISQDDQPLDIARKLLPYSYSIPSLSTNGMAIGNSSQGMFTTTLAGTRFAFYTQRKSSRTSPSCILGTHFMAAFPPSSRVYFMPLLMILLG